MDTASNKKKIAPLPNHIGIIMDGNRRWAKQHGLGALEGHFAALKNLHSLLEYFNEQQMKCVTIFLFSTENWSRSEDEIKGLFWLFEEALDKETPYLYQQGVQIRHIGQLDKLPNSLQAAIKKAVELTKNNTERTIGLAINYGGRAEILDATRRIIADGIPPQDIDEKLFSSYLYTAGLPDVDLLIRTSGEFRISNFLMWQSAYSEFYSTEVLWPDFSKEEFEKALIIYSQRQRRFGGL